MKEGKLSYASRVEPIPHKTGIPKEWLDKATNIEIVHSDDTLDSDNPKTLHLGTISKDEFLDTIRRYYLDGIIPYEDLKYIKYLTEEDIEYITSSN